jgi:hypothetical protein
MMNCGLVVDNELSKKFVVIFKNILEWRVWWELAATSENELSPNRVSVFSELYLSEISPLNLQETQTHFTNISQVHKGFPTACDRLPYCLVLQESSQLDATLASRCCSTSL